MYGRAFAMAYPPLISLRPAGTTAHRVCTVLFRPKPPVSKHGSLPLDQSLPRMAANGTPPSCPLRCNIAPSSTPNGGAERQPPKKKKNPHGRQATRRCCNLGHIYGLAHALLEAPSKLQLTSTVATIPKTPASASAAMRVSS